MSIIVSDTTTSGVLEDYDDLLAAVPLWANRTDLSPLVPQFVRVFEARVSRLLRVKNMEAPFATVSLAGGSADLPSDFMAFKELRYAGTPSYALEPRPLQWVRDQSDQATPPYYFAVTDAQVVCWPQEGAIHGTYYAAIPSLVANGTNWLFDRNPDFYLFGVLEQVGIYIRDTNLIEMAGGRAGQMLEEIKGASAADSINGGPLTIRPSVRVR